MFTAEQGKFMNEECAAAFKSAWEKVRRSNPDLHAQFVMSNVRIAVRYLQHIHQIAIDGYSPIAVSVFRTYYEIVCSTMYLAEHKDELDDFLKFGRLMYHEVGQRQNVSVKQLNQLVPDHRELRQHFAEKRKQRGGKLPSWHGMTIDDLGKAVGMEKYADHKIVRSQYFTASKLVHGDSLLTMLAYNLDQIGMHPTPFAPPYHSISWHGGCSNVRSLHFIVGNRGCRIDDRIQGRTRQAECRLAPSMAGGDWRGPSRHHRRPKRTKTVIRIGRACSE